MMNKSLKFCVALIQMKLLKTKGSKVPKIGFLKNFLGSTLSSFVFNSFFFVQSACH